MPNRPCLNGITKKIIETLKMFPQLFFITTIMGSGRLMGSKEIGEFVCMDRLNEIKTCAEPNRYIELSAFIKNV